MDTIKNKKEKMIIFSGTPGVMVTKLIEKYGLKEAEKEVFAKITAAQKPEERARVAEELPGRKVAQLLKNVAEKKINSAEMPTILQKALSLSEDKAANLAKDLEKEVLAFVEEVSPEEEIEISNTILPKKELPISVKKSSEVSVPLPPQSLQKESLPQKKRRQEKDSYRETVE